MRRSSRHRRTSRSRPRRTSRTPSSAYYRGKPAEGGPYYHGTSSRLGIEGTVRPPSETGIQTESRVQRRGKIFFTNDFDSAMQYANRAVSKWGGNPVVYEIIPTSQVKQFSVSGPMGPAFYATEAEVERVVYPNKRKTSRRSPRTMRTSRRSVRQNAARRTSRRLPRSRSRRRTSRKTIRVSDPFAPSYRLEPLVYKGDGAFAGWAAVLVDPRGATDLPDGASVHVGSGQTWRDAVRKLEAKTGHTLQPWTYMDKEPERYKLESLQPNPIPSPPDNWSDYLWWAERTFTPGTAVKLKMEWPGWQGDEYLDVPAGYKGEVVQFKVDDLSDTPEWFEVVVDVGRGMVFPGARVSQQFSTSKRGLRVEQWIEPMEDNWKTGSYKQPMRRYMLPSKQKYGLIKPNTVW